MIWTVLSNSQGSGKGSFNSPASLKSFYIGKFAYLHFMTPLEDWFSYSLKSYKKITSFIHCLLLSCCPSTVLNRIIAISIITFNCSLMFSKFLNMKVIRFKHIILKFFKIFPFTPYSSASIIFKDFIFRIITSPLHLIKDIINSTISHSVSIIMWFFLSETATRFYTSVSKSIGRHTIHFSTVTPTKPHNLFSLITISAYHKQSIKFLSRYINSFHNIMPKLDTRFASGYPVLAAKLLI